MKPVLTGYCNSPVLSSLQCIAFLDWLYSGVEDVPMANEVPSIIPMGNSIIIPYDKITFTSLSHWIGLVALVLPHTAQGKQAPQMTKMVFLPINSSLANQLLNHLTDLSLLGTTTLLPHPSPPLGSSASSLLFPNTNVQCAHFTVSLHNVFQWKRGYPCIPLIAK